MDKDGFRLGVEHVQGGVATIVSGIYHAEHVDMLFEEGDGIVVHEEEGVKTARTTKVQNSQHKDHRDITIHVGGSVGEDEAKSGWSFVVLRSSGKGESGSTLDCEVISERCGMVVTDMYDEGSCGVTQHSAEQATLHAFVASLDHVGQEITQGNIRVVVSNKAAMEVLLQSCFQREVVQDKPIITRLFDTCAAFRSKIDFISADEVDWWTRRVEDLAAAALQGKCFQEGSRSSQGEGGPRRGTGDHFKHTKRKGVTHHPMSKEDQRSVTDFTLITELESCPVQQREDQTVIPHIRACMQAIGRLQATDASISLRWLLSLSSLGMKKLQSKLSAVRKSIRKSQVVDQIRLEGDPYHLSCIMSSLQSEATAVLKACPMDDDTTFSPSEFCTTLRQIIQVANPTVVENPGMLCLCG